MLLRLDFSDIIKNSSGSGEQQHTNKGKGGRLRNPDKVTQLSLDTRAFSLDSVRCLTSRVARQVGGGECLPVHVPLTFTCTSLIKRIFVLFFIAHHQSFNVGRLRLKQNTLASPCPRVKSATEFIELLPVVSHRRRKRLFTLAALPVFNLV